MTETVLDWGQKAAAGKRERDRAMVLSTASDMAARPTPEQVLAIARTVMAWVDDASDDTDRARRFTAVKRVHSNYVLDPDRWSGVANRAVRIVDEAIELYGFLAL